MVNLLPTIRLAQSILKPKFPSVDKPLQKQAPQKGPFGILRYAIILFIIIRNAHKIQKKPASKNLKIKNLLA